MLNLNFEIYPHVGLGNVRFGMSELEVAPFLGRPEHVSRNWKGEVEEYRPGLKVVYVASSATECVAMSPAKAIYKGVDLLATDDPIALLKVDDPAPFLFAGTTVFIGLGIAITGFSEPHDPDSSVAVFAPGAWDRLRAVAGVAEAGLPS